MTDITTPPQVIAELNRLMGESQKGINALYEAEVKVAVLDGEHERTLAVGLLNAEPGTAPEKAARAKLGALEAKLQLDIAKAELNRVKAKLKSIDSAQVAVSVIARQVELQWKHA
jgi:hypothetical protein